MKTLKLNLLFLIITSLLVTGVFSQQGDVDPLVEKRRAENYRRSQEFKKGINSQTRKQAELKKQREYIERIYRKSKLKKRKPTLRELEFKKITKPRNEDINKYEAFLSEKDTGIFRLLPHKDCKKTIVIKAGDECATFYPKSSTFSFRQGFHVTDPIHDLKLVGDEFQSTGLLSIGLISNTGAFQIEDVNLKHKKLKPLLNYKPQKKIYKNKQKNIEIKVGRKYLGDNFSNSAEVKIGNVYAIRVIAYRLGRNSKIHHTAEFKGFNRDEKNEVGFEFSSFEYSEIKPKRRADYLIVFKVIRKSELDGGVTIVWKILRKKKSPKLSL